MISPRYRGRVLHSEAAIEVKTDVYKTSRRTDVMYLMRGCKDTTVLHRCLVCTGLSSGVSNTNIVWTCAAVVLAPHNGILTRPPFYGYDVQAPALVGHSGALIVCTCQGIVSYQ